METEMREIVDMDLEIGKTDDSCQERADTSLPEAVNVKLKIQQTEGEVQLPGQIEDILLIPSTRNKFPLPIHHRKATHPIAVHNIEVKAEETELKAENTEQKLLYEKCMNLFRFLGFFFGIRITYYTNPYNFFLFYFTFTVLVFAGFSVFYTVYIHCINGSYIRALEPLAISGLLVSCGLKLYAVVSHRQQMFALVFNVRKHFRHNILGRQGEILKSNLLKTWSFLMIFAMGVGGAVVYFTFTPIMMYTKTNEVMPLLPVEIVFCDQSQTSGFVVTTIIHLIMGSYCGLATVLDGTLFSFIISNYILQANLIVEDFQQLDCMWNGINNITIEYKHAFLRNICEKRQDMNNYLKTLKYISETRLFIYFCCSYFSQIICLYDITKTGWIGGYGPACGLYLEMMFYCYSGTQVSLVDDTLCCAIYDCNWYAYDSESKQLILILLHEAQQSKVLHLGAIGPLNLVTGIMITKNIYSYYTIMTEIL